MLEVVIKHELVHAAIGKNNDADSHGQKFQKLADYLGIPEKYQD